MAASLLFIRLGKMQVFIMNSWLIQWGLLQKSIEH